MSISFNASLFDHTLFWPVKLIYTFLSGRPGEKLNFELGTRSEKLGK